MRSSLKLNERALAAVRELLPTADARIYTVHEGTPLIPSTESVPALNTWQQRWIHYYSKQSSQFDWTYPASVSISPRSVSETTCQLSPVLGSLPAGSIIGLAGHSSDSGKAI
jgi:hypothetical protein